MLYNIPKLETDRLILKKGSLKDYQIVYEYDFTKLRNIDNEFELVKNNPDNIIGYEKYAEEEENVLDFIVYLKSSNIPIGNIVFDRYDKIKNSLEISCNLHPDYWRKGYMTEALISSMNYVFNHLNIDYILFGYALDNYKSKGLADKIGFNFLNEHIEHYNRINKDIKEVNTIISKEEFNNKYNK